MRTAIVVFLGLFFLSSPRATDWQSQKSGVNNFKFHALYVATDCACGDGEDTFIYEVALFKRELEQRIDKRIYNYESEQLYGKNATHDNFIKSLKDLAKKVNHNDLALIYFSLHGGYDKGHCFAPIPKDGNYICCTREQYTYGAEIQSIIDSIRCTCIVIVDTCHAGGILDKWNYPSSSTTIICACQNDETAGVMYLAIPMSEALSSGDYNGDGYIDVGELYTYSNENMKISPWTGLKAQNPTGWNIYSKTRICLCK